MTGIAILFGVLLNALGIGFYAYTQSPTALIPCAFGLLLIVFGLLARTDRMRMHMMHAAAAVGLAGVVMPAVMVARKLSAGGSVDTAATEQILMAVLCAAFVALCVKSFIDARRRRSSQSP